MPRKKCPNGAVKKSDGSWACSAYPYFVGKREALDASMTHRTKRERTWGIDFFLFFRTHNF